MPKYNITPGLRRIVAELVDAATKAKTENFEYFYNGEIGEVRFGSPIVHRVAMTPDERDVLVRANLINFRPIPAGMPFGRGMVLQSAFDAVENDFELPAAHPPATQVAIVNHGLSHAEMQWSRLTPKQQEIVHELGRIAIECDADKMTVSVNSRFCGITFVDQFRDGIPVRVPIGVDDLRALQSLGFTQVHGGVGGNAAPGSLTGQVYEALNGFPAKASAQINQIANMNTGGGAVQIIAGNENTQHIISGGDNAALIAHLISLTAELIGAMKVALPSDQADAAERDAQELTVEVQRQLPDPITIETKARAICQRFGAGLARVGELADKADKIAHAAEKLGPWLRAAWRFVTSLGS